MANEFKHKDPGAELTQAEFIASDGTGHIFDSQAAGDILYALSTTALARLAKGSDGTILELASGVPAWTASPTIGSTSWANATHAHAASNSGGTLTALGTIATGVWEGTAIATGYIAADAITGAKIADDAIDSEHYTDGSIDTAHLAADAVTGAKIADDAIDSEHYADGSIDNAHLADDAVDSDELAAGAVDTAHIGDNQVTAAKIFDLARGSVIVGNSSAATAELTIGSNTYVLTSDGTDIAWAAASAGIASLAADTTPQVGGSAGLDLQAQLLVGNGGTTGIAISANGEVTMAAQPSFLAHVSSDTNNVTGDGTEVTVSFNTEIFDQNADYNNSNFTFTAPVAGRYLFAGAVTAGGMAADSASTGFVKIVASNRAARHTFDTGSSANAAGGGAFAGIIDMDASDTCVIKFSISGVGADTADIKGDSTLLQSYFSGQLVA
jgi:hypothetical protein